MSFLDKALIELANNSMPGFAGKNRIKMSDSLRITKVAFDMVKVYGDQYDSLWRVEETDEGEFLVRASDPKFESRASENWKAISDFEGENVTLSYKGIPIARFASDEYSFSPSEVGTFKSALLDRAISDGEFLKQVFAEQPSAKAGAISDAFPELKDIIK